MAKPSYGLYDKDDKLVATIRADSGVIAKNLFKVHNLKGDYVKRVTNGHGRTNTKV